MNTDRIVFGLMFCLFFMLAGMLHAELKFDPELALQGDTETSRHNASVTVNTRVA